MCGYDLFVQSELPLYNVTDSLISDDLPLWWCLTFSQTVTMSQVDLRSYNAQLVKARDTIVKHIDTDKERDHLKPSVVSWDLLRISTILYKGLLLDLFLLSLWSLDMQVALLTIDQGFVFEANHFLFFFLDPPQTPGPATVYLWRSGGRAGWTLSCRSSTLAATSTAWWGSTSPTGAPG